MSVHPLDGAFERINRAQDHSAELKREVETFGQDYLDAAILHFNSNPPYFVKVGHPCFTHPRFRIGILVGEISYNLRAALDYLVFELARLDSGTIQNGTQFLISDTPNRFSDCAPKYFVGVNSAHIAMIVKLQPYSGCQWTKVLRDISNPDKHRTLTGTGLTATIEVVPPGFSPSFHPHISTIRRANQPDGLEVDVKLISSALVLIGVEKAAGKIVSEPVEKTCEQLVTDVRDTLEAFKPEF